MLLSLIYFVVRRLLTGRILGRWPLESGEARRSVRDTLTRWCLPGLIDSCELAVSELVTNAFRHGRPPIGLILCKTAHQVCLNVNDSDPQLLVGPGGDGAGSAERVPLGQSGWGLGIVRAVSDNHGYAPIPGGGKTMFASWRIEL